MGSARRRRGLKASLLREWGPSLLLLFVSVFLIQFALGIQRTGFNNFANDIIGVTPGEIGFLGSIREVPGLFTVLMIGAVAFLRQSTVIGISGFLIAIGLLWHGLSQNILHLSLAVVILSIGYHLLYPMQAAMVLALSKPGEKGRRMGQFSGAQAAASLLAVVVVYLLAEFSAGVSYYQVLFIGAALLAMIGGAVIWMGGRSDAKPETQSARFIFRQQYMSFYVLRLLTAAQRHMFFTFAVFLMVREYNMPIQNTAILMGISNALGIYVRPMMGRWVDRFGTRLSIMLGYSLATLTALTYAFVPILAVLYVVYIIDALLSGIEVAVTVHLDDIAPREDMAPSLALGSTINHILGLTVPIAGGLLWDQVNYQATFIMGAVISLVLVVYSRKLPGQSTHKDSPEVMVG